jgi:uncharacterized damage-inducible protein DinB
VKVAELLADAFGRIREVVHETVDGLSMDALTYRLDSGSNTIAWLIWHLARVQDDHIADVAGTSQVWTSDGWCERFGLPFRPRSTGFGHSSEQVAAVRVEAELLIGYYDAVHEQTVRFVRGLRDDDLDRIVDTSWEPPVTLGVRLISVVSDDLQHAGQAAFVRGVVERVQPLG